MTIHTYISILWVIGAVALSIWATASAITFISSTRDRNITRLITTLVLILTALVILDVARLRLKWSVIWLDPTVDSTWIAAYRTVWVVLLIWCTHLLYFERFRAWLRRTGRMRAWIRHVRG